MNARVVVMGVWAWLGRHRRALKLGSIAAAFVLCAGGVALGMNSASGSPAPPISATPPPISQKLSEHYLVGTIVEALAPGRAIVRARNGRFLVVEYDRETAVRRNGRAAPFVALRRGTRVIILGTPRDGRLHANVVTITGVAPPRQLPAVTPSLVTVTVTVTPRPAPPAAPPQTATPAPRVTPAPSIRTSPASP